MTTYRVPIICTSYGVIEIEAQSPKDAVDIAEDDISKHRVNLESIKFSNQAIKVDYLAVLELVRQQATKQ
jgi:hypothetical protein